MLILSVYIVGRVSSINNIDRLYTVNIDWSALTVVYESPDSAALDRVKFIRETSSITDLLTVNQRRIVRFAFISGPFNNWTRSTGSSVVYGRVTFFFRVFKAFFRDLKKPHRAGELSPGRCLVKMYINGWHRSRYGVPRRRWYYWIRSIVIGDGPARLQFGRTLVNKSLSRRHGKW